MGSRAPKTPRTDVSQGATVTLDEAKREDLRGSALRILPRLLREVNSAPSTLEGYTKTARMLSRVRHAIEGTRPGYSRNEAILAEMYTYAKHLARKYPRADWEASIPADPGPDDILFYSAVGAFARRRGSGWGYLLKWAKLEGHVHQEMKLTSFKPRVFAACRKLTAAGVDLKKFAQSVEEDIAGGNLTPFR